MKKYLVFIVSLLSYVFTFTTCSEEGTANDAGEKVSSISERFAVYKEIATYHSTGLGFAYNKIKSLPEKDFLTLKPIFRSTNKDAKKDFVAMLVADYVSQEDVVAKMSLFETKLKLEQVGNKGNLRSSNAQDDFSKIFAFFDKVTDKITDISGIQSVIETAIESEEFCSFSAKEQDKLLIMFAIYEDSSNYWGKNLVDWQEFLKEENGNRKLRSATVSEANNFDVTSELLMSILKADAIGAAAGAIGGAITGSFAGGVGAIPGAVGGAVGTSLIAWLMPLLANNPNQVPSAEEYYQYLIGYLTTSSGLSNN